MNNTTIPGSTDATGLFTAKNPYVNFDYPNAELGSRAYSNNKMMVAFAEAHPPLFCYNENNELVKGVEGLEVKGPVWQWFDDKFDKQWENALYEDYIRHKTFAEYQHANDLHQTLTREIYIAVQPTKKADLPISKGSLPAHLSDNLRGVKKSDTQFTYTPLPEAQPLEGVKTAEETYPELKERLSKITDPAEREAEEFATLNFSDGTSDSPYVAGYEGVLHGIQWQKENAQFATDAGGGKEIDKAAEIEFMRMVREEISDLGLDNTSVDIEEFYDKGKLAYFIKGAKWAKAPSTHSSSEMVEGWISVKDIMPMDNQIVTAKNRHSGHVGKDVSFKKGKFYHEFTSANSLETTDVEFKNVTEWKPL